MALFFENTSMVFWSMAMNGVDITSMVNKFVKSITVKDTVVEGKIKGDNYSPISSIAIISISSKSYIEDIFVAGTEISIYMGYDRLFNPLIFRGIIRTLPDGSATEMMHYTVKAYGNGSILSMKTNNRTFINTIKPYIVHQIAIENGLAAVVDIADSQIIKAQFAPIQKNETDADFLKRCAHDWKCLFWVKNDKFFDTIYFIDSNKAHFYGDLQSKDGGKRYDLGYRTDHSKSNVAKVEWKHRAPRGGSLTNPGISGFTETGKVDGPNEYRILAQGKTWKLKPQYLKEAKNNPKIFGYYTALVIKATVTLDAYTALNEYYMVEKYNDSTSKDVDPPHGESGFEINISLNIGDPYLKPPRNAYLWRGTFNPNADGADLPDWLFRNTPWPGGPAQLKINSTELRYSGRLESKLKCSMGDVGA